MWPFKATETQLEDVRIRVEEMLDNNYMPTEIAQVLKITPQRVYTIQQSKKRREKTMLKEIPTQMNSIPIVNEIDQIRIDIEKAKLNETLKETEHKNWEREQDREDAKRNDDDDIQADVVDAIDNPDKMLMLALANIFSNKNNVTNQTNQAPAPAPVLTPGEVLQDGSVAPNKEGLLDIQKLKEACKNYPMDMVVPQIMQTSNATKKDAEILYNTFRTL